MQGVSYLHFLAPALVAATSMYAACFEAGFSAYARLADQRTFHAMLNTPLIPVDIALGEILWASLKASLIGFVVFVVTLLFRLAPLSVYFLLLPVLFLNAFVFSCISLWMTTKVRSWEQWSYFFGLLLQPVFFFSGTFFPVETMPSWFRAVVELIPLYHTVEIVRPVFLGFPPKYVLLHLGLLVAAAASLFLFASRSLEHRLMEG